MKNFSALLLFLLASTTSFAQKEYTDSLRDSYENEFLFNAANFVVGGFELGYGSVKNNRSHRIFLGYYFSSSPDFYDNDDEAGGFNTVDYENMQGFRAEYQYLFMKPTSNKRRYYGGGYAVFKTIEMDIIRVANGASSTITAEYKAHATAAGVGIIGGVRHYVIDNFFVDLFLGGGITLPINGENTDDVHLDIRNPYKRSINPRGGVTLGLAF